MLFFCVGFTIFAEAPELKKVLPTEWKYMTKLSEQEKREFDNKNDKIYETETEFFSGDFFIISDVTDFKKNDVQRLKTNTVIYTQTVGSDVFYWLIMTFPVTKNESEKRFIRLYQEDNGLDLLCMMLTPQRLASQYYYDLSILTLQIIKNASGAKGFIHYLNETYVDGDDSYQTIVKKQIAGRVNGYYYLFDNKPETTEYYNNLNILALLPKNWEQITINASDFLWDEKDPLKYGLQNAFDGDPATSYVENTEDDLIEINISAGVKIQKAMIINGYAKNRELYNANNRCKVISPVKWDKNKGSWYSSPDISNSFQLSDNTFKEQMINLSTSYFYVTDIYQGSKFNDTCIAELNFKHSNGWLFGDIDEQ